MPSTDAFRRGGTWLLPEDGRRSARSIRRAGPLISAPCGCGPVTAPQHVELLLGRADWGESKARAAKLRHPVVAAFGLWGLTGRSGPDRRREPTDVTLARGPCACGPVAGGVPKALRAKLRRCLQLLGAFRSASRIGRRLDESVDRVGEPEAFSCALDYPHAARGLCTSSVATAEEESSSPVNETRTHRGDSRRISGATSNPHARPQRRSGNVSRLGAPSREQRAPHK